MDLFYICLTCEDAGVDCGGSQRFDHTQCYTGISNNCDAAFCCASGPLITSSPTNIPSSSPSKIPSFSPTNMPSSSPSASPTNVPSSSPTKVPSLDPISDGLSCQLTLISHDMKCNQ